MSENGERYDGLPPYPFDTPGAIMEDPDGILEQEGNGGEEEFPEAAIGENADLDATETMIQEMER